MTQDCLWKYTFAYDATARQFPEQIARSRELRRREAMAWLLRWYPGLAGGIPLRKVATLLGIEEEPLRRVAAELREAGEIGYDAGSGLVWHTCPY